MNKCLRGGLVGVAAVSGVVAAVVFLGTGRPNGSDPGSVPEVNGQPLVPPGPPAEPNTYFVEEMMAARVLIKKEGRTILQGIAGRRALADRTVYFVEFYDLTTLVSVCVEASEAKALGDFLKNTKGALPAEAIKENDKRVVFRRWQTRDVFGNDRYANFRVAPGDDAVTAYFGSNFSQNLVAKDFATELDKVLADIEVLKKYPVKR